MTTAYCYDDRFLLHDYPGHPENAGRLKAIVAGLEHNGLLAQLAPIKVVAATQEEITRVHTRSYMEQVRRVAERGGGHLDPDTYMNAHSFETARLAAGGVLALVRAVLEGEADNGFALVRPPGHHATPGRGMGFCLFNNIAVAARDALARPDVERVMIFDFDVHHGNGTQDAFAAAPDVLFISTHQYPYYPGTGSVGEGGHGEGAGTVVNVPLSPGVGDVGFGEIMEQIVRPLAHRYDPQLILVSAGFDAHWSDPLAMMGLSLPGYAHLARELVSLSGELCDGRLVFVLEGGYDPAVLSNAVCNTCFALLGDSTLLDPIGRSPYQETPIDNRIAEIKRIHAIE